MFELKSSMAPVLGSAGGRDPNPMSSIMNSDRSISVPYVFIREYSNCTSPASSLLPTADWEASAGR